MAKGLDIGTAFLVGAVERGDEVKFIPMRDAFFKMPPGGMVEQMLTVSQVSYFKPQGKDELYILGEEALEFAVKFKDGVLNRPMANGTINRDEIAAIDVLKVMFKTILGSPSKMNHGDVLEIILGRYDEDPNSEYKGLGYKPERINEALAIVFSELADDNYTGMALSFGAGMCNVCLSYMSAPVMTFSVARSGDYIDQRAAAESGLTPSQICKIKENDIDLRHINRSKRGHVQILVYYRNLIKYVVEYICNEFSKAKQGIEGDEIPIVVSGGTSKVPGFTELFEEIFMEAVNKEAFPLKPSKIVQAKDPLTAVAQGCYMVAKSKEAKLG